MADDVLFSVSQVAILLKVHSLTIRRYIKEGKLRAVKLGGNVRIPQSSIDAFSQNIYPTSYSLKDKNKMEISQFDSDDPIFRLKGRGLSLKGI